MKVTGNLKGHVNKIPHGLNNRFNKIPKKQYEISTYSINNPYRIIYVSNIELYKHQWNVVKAIANLRNLGLYHSL